MVFIEILFPVFALMILGGGLRHIGFMDAAMENAFNRFCYFVALPVFITYKVATAPLLDSRTLQASVGLQIVTLGIWGLAILAAPLFSVSRRSKGTFTQASFRGNLAYTGLPVLTFAMADRSSEELAAATTEAVLALGGVVLLYNLLGVVSLEWDRRHEQGGNPWKKCLVSSAKNPLLLSCIIGLGVNVSGFSLPDTLSRIALPIGQTAFPLALIAIGARIRGLTLTDFGLPVVGAVLLKNAGSVALGVLVASLLGLEGTSRLVLLILCATPTAVASYVLVDQMDGDRNLAASTIAVSTLVSTFSLSAALALGL